MIRISSAIGAAFLAAAMTVSTLGTASAAPVTVQPLHVSSNVELAQHYEKRRPRAHRNTKKRIENRRGYWNGHRGYREHRKGYRRHSDGYYYAPSVFKLYIR